jgi:hypothetical protein
MYGWGRDWPPPCMRSPPPRIMPLPPPPPPPWWSMLYGAGSSSYPVLLCCTFRRFEPIWKPFIELIAASALATVSYETNPVGNKDQIRYLYRQITFIQRNCDKSMRIDKLLHAHRGQHSPNPLESEVFLSTNTFADITFPKGAKRVGKSASVKSRGRW